MNYKRFLLFVTTILSLISGIFVVKNQMFQKVMVPGISGIVAINSEALTMSQYTRLISNDVSDGIGITTSNIIIINGIGYTNIPNHSISISEAILREKVIYNPKFRLVARFTADVHSDTTPITDSQRNAADTGSTTATRTIRLPSASKITTFTSLGEDGEIITSLDKITGESFYTENIDKIRITSTNSGNFLVMLSRRISTAIYTPSGYEIDDFGKDELGVDFLDDRKTFTFSFGSVADSRKVYIYGEIYYVP